jgi:hypothetical protein
MFHQTTFSGTAVLVVVVVVGVFPTHGEHDGYLAMESNPRTREIYAKFPSRAHG